MNEKIKEQRKKFDALVIQNKNILESVEKSSKVIDEKIKGFQALLLDQTLHPKLDQILVTKLDNIEQGQFKFREMAGNSNQMAVGEREILEKMDQHFLEALDEQQERTRRTIILSGLIVATITSVAAYTANR